MREVGAGRAWLPGQPGLHSYIQLQEKKKGSHQAHKQTKQEIQSPDLFWV